MRVERERDLDRFSIVLPPPDGIPPNRTDNSTVNVSAGLIASREVSRKNARPRPVCAAPRKQRRVAKLYRQNNDNPRRTHCEFSIELQALAKSIGKNAGAQLSSTVAKAQAGVFSAMAPLRLRPGSYAPGILDRGVFALTSRMRLNGLGLRLAILLRRISTMRLEYPAGALDVLRWGMRLRLHPIDDGCEKNLLFTPQMYETTELAALSEEIFRVREQRRKFVFVDIGANVGLFSIFVAATAKLNVQNSRCRTCDRKLRGSSL